MNSSSDIFVVTSIGELGIATARALYIEDSPRRDEVRTPDVFKNGDRGLRPESSCSSPAVHSLRFLRATRPRSLQPCGRPLRCAAFFLSGICCIHAVNGNPI